MRKYICIGILVLMLASIAGCSEETAAISQNSITVAKDQSLSVTLVEEFQESYYDETELINMVNSEVTAYNTAAGKDCITVGDHLLENGQMHLTLEFVACTDFCSYMPEDLFVGTVQEAYDKGYDFNRSLESVGSNGATIGKNDLLSMGNSKIVVLTGAMVVRCPSKITYYSQGMELLDSHTVRATTEGCYFIIYK